MSRLRKVIAQRMVESLQISAQLTTVAEVDLTTVARLRARAKSAFAQREGVNLSYLPFLALSLVLCGTGLAAALLPPLLNAATARWGWQAGYVTLGALVGLFWLSMAWRRLPATLPGASPHAGTRPGTSASTGVPVPSVTCSIGTTTS